MEIWLWAAIGVMATIIVVLFVKIYTLQKSAKEIKNAFADRLMTETNTLIDISSNDKYMRELAASINIQLRKLREERHFFIENGDGNTEADEHRRAIPEEACPFEIISGHLLGIPDHCKCPGAAFRQASRCARAARIMLRSLPGHVSDAAAEKYPGPDPDGPVLGILKERRQLPGARVIRAPEVRLDDAHIRVNNAIGDIYAHIIVLIAVPGTVYICLIDRFLVDICLDLPTWVAVCSIRRRFEPDRFSAHECLYNMASAVVESPGIDGVPGVVVGHCRCADIDVDGGNAGVCRDVVEVTFSTADFDPGLGVA